MQLGITSFVDNTVSNGYQITDNALACDAALFHIILTF